jgi:coiled-coil-helix-coiled-coil-helix domain-containing protein 10
MGRRPAPARSSPPVQSRPHSTQAQAPQTTPAPMQSAPPAVQSSSSGGGGMLSGIGATIAQGMAFGTGSAIAHRAVGAVAGAMTGGSTDQPVEAAVANTNQPLQQPQQLSGACANDKQMFYECLQTNKGDQQACSFLYEQLKQCQAETTSMSFQ